MSRVSSRCGLAAAIALALACLAAAADPTDSIQARQLLNNVRVFGSGNSGQGGSNGRGNGRRAPYFYQRGPQRYGDSCEDFFRWCRDTTGKGRFKVYGAGCSDFFQLCRNNTGTACPDASPPPTARLRAPPPKRFRYPQNFFYYRYVRRTGNSCVDLLTFCRAAYPRGLWQVAGTSCDDIYSWCFSRSVTCQEPTPDGQPRPGVSPPPSVPGSIPPDSGVSVPPSVPGSIPPESGVSVPPSVPGSIPPESGVSVPPSVPGSIDPVFGVSVPPSVPGSIDPVFGVSVPPGSIDPAFGVSVPPSVPGSIPPEIPISVSPGDINQGISVSPDFGISSPGNVGSPGPGGTPPNKYYGISRSQGGNNRFQFAGGNQFQFHLG